MGCVTGGDDRHHARCRLGGRRSRQPQPDRPDLDRAHRRQRRAGANYGGISADGSRVYFTTVESLVGADTDSADDVYERARDHDHVDLDRADQRQRRTPGALRRRLGGRHARLLRHHRAVDEHGHGQRARRLRTLRGRHHAALDRSKRGQLRDRLFLCRQLHRRHPRLHLSYDALTSDDTDTGPEGRVRALGGHDDTAVDRGWRALRRRIRRRDTGRHARLLPHRRVLAGSDTTASPTSTSTRAARPRTSRPGRSTATAHSFPSGRASRRTGAVPSSRRASR